MASPVGDHRIGTERLADRTAHSDYDVSDDSDYGDSESSDDSGYGDSGDSDSADSDGSGSVNRINRPPATARTAHATTRTAARHTVAHTTAHPAARSTRSVSHTRPMSSGEQQYRNGCRQGYIVDDCSQFDVPHLLQRGINPNL